MGKTAVFVLACIQMCLQTEADLATPGVRVLVLAHCRELAYQIQTEFVRFAKHVKELKIAAVFGGTPIEKDREMLKKECPHILCGTPGRVLGLLRDKDSLKLESLAHMVIDECDQCIDNLSLRRDVQQIFIKTPKKKQVMMFSATIGAETRMICKKFMQGPHEIFVESEKKLTLDGLLQYFVKVTEKQKIKRLIDLLDTLEFNQVVIFTKSVKRALALDGLLRESNFPSMTLHAIPKDFGHKVKSGDPPGPNDGRIERLKQFKAFQKRILVATDLFGRGMDVERVNIVINFDMSADDTAYLHRVGRAGRFGTKGLTISFVASDEDTACLAKVQDRFEVNIGEMPATIDTTSYLNA